MNFWRRRIKNNLNSRSDCLASKQLSPISKKKRGIQFRYNRIVFQVLKILLLWIILMFESFTDFFTSETESVIWFVYKAIPRLSHKTLIIDKKNCNFALSASFSIFYDMNSWNLKDWFSHNKRVMLFSKRHLWSILSQDIWNQGFELSR